MDEDILAGGRMVPGNESFFHIATGFLATLIICHSYDSNLSLEECAQQLGLAAEPEFIHTYGEYLLGRDSHPIPWSSIGQLIQHNRANDRHMVFKTLEYFQGAVMGRRCFQTKEGYLGLGPVGISPGDIIYMLLGFTGPIALRRVEGHFIVVGICFVLGLMDGEAFAVIESEPSKVQNLEIL
jgi:hypothetical protein